MVLGLCVWHTIALCITRQILVAAVPFSSQRELSLLSSSAELIEEPPPTKIWSALQARAPQAAAAAASAGITDQVLQTQNVTSTAGANETTHEPGVISNSNYTDPAVNCSDLHTGRDNKCWEELNLTDYVKDWTSKTQCRQNEGFSTCFLRWAGFYGLDCAGIKIAACTSPQGSTAIDPKIFYVAYNIYAINQFFLSWYTAVGNSASIAGQNVDEIVQLIDPLDNTHLILDDVLLALTGIFALAPDIGLGVQAIISGLRSVSNLNIRLVTALQTVENALFAFPQIGRFLFPVDTAASQVVQMASLKTELVNLVSQVQTNLNMTLTSVMANSTEFLAFASQGNFTASAPSLPDQENYLLYAFNTYVISAGLSGNNVYGTLGLNTNVQQLATNSSSKHGGIDLSACKSYNDQKICDAWWYSEKFNSSFGLDNFSKMNRNYGPILTNLLQNYTTGELLFENAYSCNSNGNYGQPVNVSVNAGGVHTECLSQLQIVTWDMECTEPLQKQCEFIEIPRQNTFWGDCNTHSYFSVMDAPVYCVPYTYLGPLINTNSVNLKRT